MIRKLIPVEVKEVGDRTLEIAGSTEDKDRLGDIIRASGWQLAHFKKNPVFMWAHRYNDPPIGKATKVWVDKETKHLMFRVEFAGQEIYEFADTIFKLYKGGFLHATSVGFIPLDWEGKDEEHPYPKWEGNDFTKQELLELSAVPVPANANALVTARDQGLITVKEFEAVMQEPIVTYEPPHALALKLDAELMALDGIITKPEETENWIRIPVKGEEGKHKDHRIRNIPIDEKKGIRALYCGECKKITTYLFDKEKGWTMATAQEWVDEHSKSVDDIIGSTLNEPETLDIEWLLDNPPVEREFSQADLGDQIDYTLEAVRSVGLNQDNMPVALSLASEIIQRATGSDIPDDILSKVGMVLNAKNKQRLTDIQQLAQEVFDSAGAAEDGDKPVTLTDPQPDPVAIATQRAIDVAEVANLVLAKLKGKRIQK